MIIKFATNESNQMIEITDQVREAVKRSGVSSGLVHISSMHTTGAVTINENADPAVSEDMITFLNKLVPWGGDFRHSEGNSAAHIKTSLFGVTQTIAIEDNDLVLGTWQGIFFCEFDGPRNRIIHLAFLS